MKNHDPGCKGGSNADEKLLDDVAKYGWHVMKVLETPETPGWAYSVGLFKSFGHAQILVIGQDSDLMHYMINTIGGGVQQGKSFAVDERYADAAFAGLQVYVRDIVEARQLQALIRLRHRRWTAHRLEDTEHKYI